MSCKTIFPSIGLLLFAAVTYSSYRASQIESSPGRYFWWSSLRLDSDPMTKRPVAPAPCDNREANCTRWDLFEDRWIDPGWIAMGLMLSALPAFVVGAVIVHGLGRLGVNEVWTFMVSTPLLLFIWFYFIGWLVDRWRLKRHAHPSAK